MIIRLTKNPFGNLVLTRTYENFSVVISIKIRTQNNWIRSHLKMNQDLDENDFKQLNNMDLKNTWIKA